MGRPKVNTYYIKRLLFLPLLVILTLGAAPPGAWELIDKFKNVSAGEWVRLSYGRRSEHLLLVAAKDDKTITLEELIKEQGYVTSWTQMVIDLKKRLPVVLRERMPLGEIREIEIKDAKASLDEDFYALLTARFWQEPGTQRVVVPAGRFVCKEYHAVYNKKSITIFFSNKIPLYPVKVLIPGYNLIIKLAAFGKGMESRFLPPADTAPQSPVDKTPVDEHSPIVPANSEAGSGARTK